MISFLLSVLVVVAVGYVGHKYEQRQIEKFRERFK